MPWGLALSGGGVMGAAHLGVLRALREWGLQPGVLSGTSAGGLIVGALAAGAPLDDIVAATAQVCAQPRRYFRARVLSILAELLPDDPLPPADALIDPSGFVDCMVGTCPGPCRIEGWRIPTAIPAYDLAAMRGVVFVRPPAGAVVRPVEGWTVRLAAELRVALQATMAMPGVFAPVRADGEFLVDGGVTDNLPMDWAAALGATRVVAVDVAPLHPGLPPRPGIIWTLSRVEASFTHALSDLRRPRVPILTIAPDTTGTSVFGFGDFDRLVDAGYRAATAQRDGIVAFVSGGGAGGG